MTQSTSTIATITDSTADRLRIVVVCPHFAPDIAPTGVVMTRIVAEWTAAGHEVHVVTALPWYRRHRVEDAWRGRLWRTERTEWGSIRRLHPLSTRSKANIVGRAVGFVVFSVLAAFHAARIGGRGRVDAVVAMSPPLTLGLAGWIAAVVRRSRLVFNVQDVFPDAVVATGAVRNRALIAAASALEKFTYRRSAAVVVLSDGLADNVRAKMPAALRSRVVVIGNFVDTVAIIPQDRLTAYRRELGLGERPVVMYAGNVGFSQALDSLVDLAREMPDVDVVINGDGAARPALRERAAALGNVVFGDYQPGERLSEVLATADVHVVTLRAGLGAVSVPSKTYSILAAARPVVAAVDADSAIDRLVRESGAGTWVAPEDSRALVAAVRTLVADPHRAREMGAAGRRWVELHATPQAVARAYERVIRSARGSL